MINELYINNDRESGDWTHSEKKSQAGNGGLWACRQCYKKWAYNIYFRRCWCFHQQLNSALPMGKKSPVINTRIIKRCG